MFRNNFEIQKCFWYHQSTMQPEFKYCVILKNKSNEFGKKALIDFIVLYQSTFKKLFTLKKHWVKFEKTNRF